MSSIINPIPEMNSETTSIANTTGRGPPASGTSTSGSGNRMTPSVYTGPMPNRRVSGPVITEPISVPTAAVPSTRPIAAAEMCSSWVTYRK